MSTEELADFLRYPTGSRFGTPEMHRTAISQLEGLPYEGKPGYFPFPVSGRRLLLFHQQVTDVDADGRSVAICGFYERLRSPDELTSSMRLHDSLSDRGVEFRNLPKQMVVVSIYPSMFDAPDGIVPTPEDDERSIGDHIVALLGYKDEHLFFLNNWGPEWGVQGVGAYPLDYLKRYWREAWSVRGVTGPHPDLGGSLGPSGERWQKLCAGAWDEEESTDFFALHYGAVVDVFGRWLIGVGDGSMWLQCIAVLHEADTRPLIVGWLHIRGTSDGADVEELFVWPPYRERGIATTLTGLALLYAATTPWQHGRWHWHESKADSLMRERSHWKPRIPRWLNQLLSNADSGVTGQVEFLALLERLAKLESLDGVRLSPIPDETDASVNFFECHDDGVTTRPATTHTRSAC